MTGEKPERRLMCLIKFFSKQKYLDDLLGGILYCNTPEFYRLYDGAGVGDKSESCIFSYRKHRDIQAPVLKINDHIVDGLVSMTVHGNRIKDSWLHCWFAFYLPETDEEFYSQIEDLNRVREECGQYFAVLAGEHISKVAGAIEKKGHKTQFGKVSYSDQKIDWSAQCKSSDYGYQREFRFLIDECGPHETEAKSIQLGEDIAILFMPNETLEMKDSKSGDVLFKLTMEGVEHL